MLKKPSTLAVCLLLSAQVWAGDNPFHPPSERQSAMQPVCTPEPGMGEEAEMMAMGMPDVPMVPQMDLSLVEKKDEFADARYVGMMNGKEVYFHQDKKTYIYRDVDDTNTAK